MRDRRAELTTEPRLRALERAQLLDTPPEEAFDRLTRLASAVLDVPVALVTIVDGDRQFFKSGVGVPEPWASKRETPLSYSFCQHVAADGTPLAIEDARLHELVKDNHAITEFGARAYCGFPLRSPSGDVLGSVCVIDLKPRAWKSRELDVVRELAESATTEVALREATRETDRQNEELRALLDDRQVHALALNDDVIQGLTAARLALSQGRDEDAAASVEHAAAKAKTLLKDLLADAKPEVIDRLRKSK